MAEGDGDGATGWLLVVRREWGIYFWLHAFFFFFHFNILFLSRSGNRPVGVFETLKAGQMTFSFL